MIFKQLDEKQSLQVLKVIEDFEDDDDVQNVYHSLELTESLISALES